MTELQPAQRYLQARANLMQQAPAMGTLLPEQWPAQAPVLEQRRTIDAMRLATSTLNEGLLLVGLGDGSVLKYLRGDPHGRSKLVQVLILGPEITAFAHMLGHLDLAPLFKELHLCLHFVQTAENLGSVISRAFSDHGQIARSAGTRA